MKTDERQNIITKLVNFTSNRGVHANSFHIGDGSKDVSLKDNITTTKDTNTCLIGDSSSGVNQNEAKTVT